MRWFTDRKEVVYGQSLTAATLAVASIRQKKSCSHRIASAGHMQMVVGFLLRIRVEAKFQTKQCWCLSGNCLLQKSAKTLPNSDVVEEEQSQTWNVHYKVVEYLPPWWYECAVTLAVQFLDQRFIDIGG